MKKRLLIVIPNRGAIFYAWALEAGRIFRKDGYEIFVLDVSRVNSRYQRSFWKWYVDLVSFKNPAPRTLKSVANDMGFHNIDLTDAKRLSEKLPSVDFWNMTQVREIFERSLRSTFALSFGHSQFATQEIPQIKREYEEATFRGVLDITSKILLTYDIDEVLTCNGRLVPQAAVVASSIVNTKTCKLVEMYGSPNNRFFVYDTTPHDVEEIRKKVLETWGDVQGRYHAAYEIGVESLKKRIRRGSRTNTHFWRSLNLKRHQYIAFFPSSDYEFAAVASDKQLGNIHTQEEVFKELVRYCREREIQLVVRVHPHADHKFLADRENNLWIERSKKESVICIESQDPVNSIELARNSYVSVTHASSIALELCFLGLPHLITSRTPFFPDSNNNVILDLGLMPTLLNSIPASPYKEEAIRFAYFEEVGGNLMEQFHVEDVHTIYYRGERVDAPTKLMSVRIWIAKLKKMVTQEFELVAEG